MGVQLSKQEELFVLHQWPELLENAMSADAAIDNDDSDKHKYASKDFSMSFQEWQALITLLDNSHPSEVPSRLCAECNNEKITNPIVVIMIHAYCWFDKSISPSIFAERLIRLQEEVVSCKESKIWRKTGEEGDAERELVKNALSVLIRMAQPDTATTCMRHAEKEVIKSLVSFNRSKRPVVTLAQVFIAAVVACIQSNSIYATTAIESLRTLQEAMREAATSVLRTRRSTQTNFCNIIEWYAVQRLEKVLLSRQQEHDVSDMLSIINRWWIPSISTANVLSTSTTEERWSAVSSTYIGQKHVWEALKQHYMSSEVFDVEKPTVILLFGPSGFGKSELARRLACVLHSQQPNEVEVSGKLVYIHLPSFCTRDSIYSLVDPPAAHIGEGLLLTALQKNDDAVVVLDEFEKGTAEAIQNLWLSAFQKRGMLRSLKDTSRSVSTEKATFVLTCNIAADIICRSEKQYLEASTSQQRAIQAEWTRVCKEKCRESFHEPFVNRIDYFFPLVPYSEEEKEQFIHLHLRRIVADQRAKERSVYITPRLVRALVKQLETFHASTIENVVRPLLAEMTLHKWNRAVLTVMERLTGTEFVTLPADPFLKIKGITSWCSVPQWEQALAVWDAKEESPLAEGKISVASLLTANKRSAAANSMRVQQASRHTSDLQVKALHSVQAYHVMPDVSIEVDKKLDVHVETALEKILFTELERTKELLLEKDKEIAYLKEKVLQLERIVGVLLVTTLACLFLLSFVLGVKLVLVISVILMSAIWLIVGMPLHLLFGAIRVLYRFLGPFGSAILGIIVSLWISLSVRKISLC